MTKSNGIHTPKEFLNITRKFAKSKSSCYGWKDNKYKCPKKGDLKGWMKWTGAEYTDAEVCRKSAAQTQKNMKKSERIGKKIKYALDKVNKCVTKKCSKLEKARKEEQEKHYQTEKKTCTQKNTKAYLNCSTKLFDASNYKKLAEKVEECAKMKCTKERQALHKLLNL